MTRDPDAPYYAVLRSEGVHVPSDRTPKSTAPLPSEKVVKGLTNAIRAELLGSESDRAEHMTRVTEGWDIYNLRAYEPEEMLLAEQQSLTLPTVRARVDQAHGGLYAALALSPFYQADVTDGADGTPAIHAQAAIGEELDRCEFENALDINLRSSLVGTIGYFKSTTVQDERGQTRLDVEAVDPRDLYLSPHNVRDTQQCNLMAHAYTETLGWIRDQALYGTFDMAAVRKLSAGHVGTADDGGGSERAQQGLPDGDSLASDDSQKVEILECYIKYRPRINPDEPLDPNAKTWKPSEMWRVFLDRKNWVILRAEEWEDGFPFHPLRHQRGQTTIYAPSFPTVLKDIQWASDMLMSASIEADRMGVAPVWQVPVNSLAMEFLKSRQDESGGRAVRPVAGDVIPVRTAMDEMKPIYFPPTPPQIGERLNRLEQLASLATVTVQPMQTFRTATEHRYAMSSVSAKEQQMLKVLRADLSRLGEYLKRLYWKYVARATYSDMTGQELKQIVHGTTGYTMNAQTWGMIRLTPRGMSTAGDQMLAMQASQEALALTAQFLPQKPMFEQAGLWPFVWYALSRRLDALGIQDWEKYIGPNPATDPAEVELDPSAQQRKMQASMMLMQANNPAGGAGVMQAMNGLPGADGGDVRASDGAPTTIPGGNPGGMP